MRNKYILQRHGETIYQTKKKEFLYPWPDFVTGLTKKGKKQARDAASRLKNKNIGFIYCSDFLRTRQTTEIIAKEIGLSFYFNKRLRDINWGIFRDGPMKNYLHFFSSKKQKFFKRPAKGENWRDVKKRMVDFIKDIDKKYKNQTILIVSHGDPLWLLYGTIKGLNEKQLLAVRQNKDFYPEVGQYLEL
ncbi:MAG: histidine phosphatase family protein [Candidatus Nealsonbacteria bacterium]|nr:histidine phosphatase family protein [Candidatus Nealsonbacteria bacterium]